MSKKIIINTYRKYYVVINNIFLYFHRSIRSEFFERRKIEKEQIIYLKKLCS